MLYRLHPAQMEKAERSDYKELVKTIHQFYNFVDNLEQDAMSWYDKGIFLSENQEELEFVNLVKNMELFPSDDNTTDPARHYLYSRKIIQHDETGQILAQIDHV